MLMDVSGPSNPRTFGASLHADDVLVPDDIVVGGVGDFVVVDNLDRCVGLKITEESVMKDRRNSVNHFKAVLKTT